MNTWLAVCCLLITGVVMAQDPQSGLNTGEVGEAFGLQDLANIQMRHVRETKSRKKKTGKKTNKKTKGKRGKNKNSRNELSETTNHHLGKRLIPTKTF